MGEYDPEYDCNTMPHEHRLYSRAVHWADLTAKEASVGCAHVSTTGFNDALGWLVRKMMLAVCMNFQPQSDKKKNSDKQSKR